jgi:hypothetical protein
MPQRNTCARSFTAIHFWVETAQGQTIALMPPSGTHNIAQQSTWLSEVLGLGGPKERKCEDPKDCVRL